MSHLLTMLPIMQSPNSIKILRAQVKPIREVVDSIWIHVTAAVKPVLTLSLERNPLFSVEPLYLPLCVCLVLCPILRPYFQAFTLSHIV